MNANELADKLLEDLREVDLFNMDSDMYGNRQHYIEQLESLIRQQQAEIEALKAKTQYWLHTLHCSCGRHWEVTTYPPKLVEANK